MEKIDEFKINVFYEMYKESVSTPRAKFREEFKKHHGDFKYINELMLRIENYQIDRYGSLLNNNNDYGNKEDALRKSINAKNRKRYYENKRV